MTNANVHEKKVMLPYPHVHSIHVYFPFKMVVFEFLDGVIQPSYIKPQNKNNNNGYYKIKVLLTFYLH